MNILIIDDHPLLRAGLGRLFAIEFDATIVEAATADDGLKQFRATKPDVTVLDLNLPDQGGLSLLRHLKNEEPEARVVILSMHNDTLSAAACLRGGAIAYLSKSAEPELILEAIRKALQGEPYLQPTIAQDLAIQQVTRPDDPFQTLQSLDLEILRLILSGKRQDQIAQSLGLAEKTVANRKTSLRAKLRVTNDVELVKAALAAGMTVG
jgi:two-component system, NarL family, invasion response regulator UvrY